MNADRKEHGQAVILIVIAIVAMLGFVGLAVDGGRVYSEKRRAQNAADAAAYAAAMAAIEDEDAVQAAVNQALLNEYKDGEASSNVTINHPPQHGEYAGDPDYYEVMIDTDVNATFGRAVAMDKFHVQAIAVAHARPIEAVTDGNVIHALEDNGTGIEYKGNVGVHVSGGNILSNSGQNKLGTSGDIIVKGGQIEYVTGNTDDWRGTVSPAPVKVSKPVYLTGIPTPDCGSTAGTQVESRTKITFKPGIFSSEVRITGNKDIKFDPGMYCLMDGMHINANVTVSGRDVFFVVMGGDLEINGGAGVRLYRPNNLIDPSKNQWGGMLVYVSPDNGSAIVDLSGNASVNYAGTVYHPKGLCRVGGNGSAISLSSNVVCNQILFHGNPTININYKKPQNYQMPPIIELSE